MLRKQQAAQTRDPRYLHMQIEQAPHIFNSLCSSSVNVERNLSSGEPDVFWILWYVNEHHVACTYCQIMYMLESYSSWVWTNFDVIKNTWASFVLQMDSWMLQEKRIKSVIINFKTLLTPEARIFELSRVKFNNWHCRFTYHTAGGVHAIQVDLCHESDVWWEVWVFRPTFNLQIVHPVFIARLQTETSRKRRVDSTLNTSAHVHYIQQY